MKYQRNLKTKLQKESFKKLSQLKVGALFIKMGKGKTRIAVDLIDYNKCDLLLYVCPFSAKENIIKEFIKWELKTPYIIVGYETISMSDVSYLKLLNKIKGKKCFIVADDSVFIKNDTTIRFNRLLELRKHCEYALILNGTPITKNEWDLYNQMLFLSPKIFNMSRNQFLNTFFKQIRGRNKKGNFNFYQFSEVNAELLYQLIEPYIVYSNMSFIEPNKKSFLLKTENTSYQQTKIEHLDKMQDNGSFSQIMILIMKLNYIASLDENKMKHLIKHIKNKKVVCFCAFLDEVKYIKNKIDCLVITGEVKNRTEIINEFERSNKPLIMTYGVGSYSLNLQFADEIHFSSLIFDYGKVEQAEHRINRLGQKENIKVYYHLADLGINKTILKNLENKIKLKDLIEKHIKKGTINEWLKSM